FEWSKDKNIPGIFEMTGRFHKTGQELDLQMLSLRAPGAEIFGAVYTKTNEEAVLTDISFNFNPFIIGATNAAIAYEDEHYSLTGESFNFSKIGEGRIHADLKLKDGTYDINL